MAPVASARHLFAAASAPRPANDCLIFLPWTTVPLAFVTSARRSNAHASYDGVQLHRAASFFFVAHSRECRSTIPVGSFRFAGALTTSPPARPPRAERRRSAERTDRRAKRGRPRALRG